MVYDRAIICILCTFLLIMTLITIVMIVMNHKHKKKFEEITMYQINTSAMIDGSIPKLLDLIIDESFTDYRIKSLVDQEGVINSEREGEIRNELVRIVSGRISNAALEKLSLFYNMKNIADILADKIYIRIMDYVVDHNKTISE